jgi:hypothetical protein
VKQYEDEKGKYVIQAERIDRLVVGEHIVMTEKATPASGKAGGNG